MQLVFLVYLNRSGSTYLATLLDQYKEIGVSLEAEIPDGIHYHRRIYLTSQKEIEEYIERLYRDERFTAWQFDKQILQERFQKMLLPITFKHILPAILQENFKDSPVTTYIYKSPYIYHLEKIRTIFPTAKVIFISRDLRAMYNSQHRTKSTFGGGVMATNPIKTAILYNMIMTIKKAYSEENWFHAVQYEDLLTNQKKEMRRILQFLQLSDLKDVDNSAYFAKLPEKEKNIHKNITSQPILQRIHAWKEELTREEIWLLQHISKRTLMKHGYALYPIEKLSLKNTIKILWYWIRFALTIDGKYTILRCFQSYLQAVQIKFGSD